MATARELRQQHAATQAQLDTTESSLTHCKSQLEEARDKNTEDSRRHKTGGGRGIRMRRVWRGRSLV